MEEKQIPNSPDIEMAIIGTMLMSSDSDDRIADILKYGCTADMFFTATRRALFKLIVNEYNEGRWVDKLHLQAKIFNDQSKSLGDLGDLIHCESLQLVSFRIENAVKSLAEYHIRRGLISGYSSAANKAYDNNIDVYSLIEGTTDTTDKLLGMHVEGKDYKDMSDGLGRLKERWVKCSSNDGMVGISSGCPRIDLITRGFCSGELICYSGRESSGKSVLMLQCLSPLIIAKAHVAVFTGEMEVDEVMARILSNHGDINMDVALNGAGATKSDLRKIKRVAEEIDEADIKIYDDSEHTISQIQARCSIASNKRPLDAVIIDYWQLIESPEHAKEEERLKFTSRKLKQLAKKLGCPVITGSQLNEDNKTFGSKAMQKDGNVLIRIVRDSDEIKSGLVVDKSRNSQRGQFIPLRLNGSKQRFE